MDYTDKLDIAQERDEKRVKLLRDAVVNAQIRLKYLERKSPALKALLAQLEGALAQDDALFEASLALLAK